MRFGIAGTGGIAHIMALLDALRKSLGHGGWEPVAAVSC